MDSRRNLYVSEPSLPEIEKYSEGLINIWETRTLTNSGAYQKALEAELCKYLGVEHLTLVCNGTLGLLLAIKALDLKGEVITTPFTFVATSAAIQWAGLTPVYVDIEPDGVNISPKAIEKAITSKTSAILPVHCYGNVCNTKEIEAIAKRHNLKVIYDAAHSFGSKDKAGKSVLSYGDLSVASFHATKVFHTIEGGAIIAKTAEMKKKLDALATFGTLENLDVDCGINAKMHEFAALMGLLNLKNIGKILTNRRNLFEQYVKELKPLSQVALLNSFDNLSESNYPYLAVRLSNDLKEKLASALAEKKIFARKYFSPLVSNLVEGRGSENLPYAVKLCDEVLCLPLHENMTTDDVHQIVSIMKEVGCQ